MRLTQVPRRPNRPKPGRGLAEVTEQPRATTGYVSLWPAARLQLRRRSGHVMALHLL